MKRRKAMERKRTLRSIAAATDRDKHMAQSWFKGVEEQRNRKYR